MSSKVSKLSPLTGIRAIAAIWVVLYHVDTHTILDKLDFGLFTPLVLKGFLGVDLFFMLSGFILSYVHQKDFIQFKFSEIKQFLGLRLARIYPVHLFMLILFGLFYITSVYVLHNDPQPPKRYTLWLYGLNILNMQSWLTSQDSWNYPSWSISAEWFAYLGFPFLMPWLSQYKKPALNIALIIGILGVMAVIYHFRGQPLSHWTYQIGLLRVASEFVIGCSLYNLFAWIKTMQTEKPEISIPWDFGTIASASLVVYGCYAQWNEIALVGILAVFLFCLTNAQQLMQTLLGNRAMVYMGEVSYAVYMVHLLYIIIFRQALLKLPETAFSGLPNLGLISALVLGLLVFAAIVYHAVEVPCRQVIRNWILNGKPKPVLVPDIRTGQTAS